MKEQKKHADIPHLTTTTNNFWGSFWRQRREQTTVGVLACIFCDKTHKQGVAKTAEEENLAQKWEDSDSKEAHSEPALLQPGSSSPDEG